MCSYFKDFSWHFLRQLVVLWILLRKASCCDHCVLMVWWVQSIGFPFLSLMKEESASDHLKNIKFQEWGNRTLQWNKLYIIIWEERDQQKSFGEGGGVGEKNISTLCNFKWKSNRQNMENKIVTIQFLTLGGSCSHTLTDIEYLRISSFIVHVLQFNTQSCTTLQV